MTTKPKLDLPVFSAPATQEPAPRLELVFTPQGSVAGFLERTQQTPKEIPNDRK